MIIHIRMHECMHSTVSSITCIFENKAQGRIRGRDLSEGGILRNLPSLELPLAWSLAKFAGFREILLFIELNTYQHIVRLITVY